MRFVARLVGGIASVLFDMRRVKCRDHWLNPYTSPPTCLSCWNTE